MDIANIAYCIRSQSSSMHKTRVNRLREAFGVTKETANRFIDLHALGYGTWAILPK